HMVEATSAPTESPREDDHDHDHDHEHDHEHGELPPRRDAPLDWLDRFGRSFYPTRHVHLGEGEEREILPWIRMSAELNPQRVTTYTTAAYWLRRHLGKPDEAEKFLRDGLRANPGNPEILFELGRLYDEDHKDPERARNLYELALRGWEAARNPEEEEEDLILFRQIVVHLAWLEERQNDLARAIHFWRSLLPKLEDKSAIQQRIDELEARLESPAADPTPTSP
ncbi:MAG: tetratricopeptide repeat protein, partial [Verrucomicrobia bacterium]|nr:tetratricopeptide repeat protein [Verrucomicrobiota bacterium]